MTMTYRNNDPVSGRWTGIGTDLSAFQIDSNFYELVTRVATLESNTKLTVSISYITITGNDITFHMTDHTIQGPFTIPISTFNDRGTWQPTTPYLVNDTFNINGTLYLVIFAHTSAATFDPNANDGAGHFYYKSMISVPGSALPIGGVVGQALVKTTIADYATGWGGWTLPAGGTANQRLAKIDNVNGNTRWVSDLLAGLVDVGLGSPHLAGQVLQYNGTVWTNTNLVVTFSEISDVALGSPLLPGQLFSYNGTHWTNVSPATSAEYLSNVANKLLLTDKVWTAAAPVALTDAVTIAVDMSTFINAFVLLGGNRTLGNPTNTKNGQTGVIQFTQDATGSRTLAYASNWKFASGAAPTLTTTANAVDLLFYEVLASNFIYATLVKDVK